LSDLANAFWTDGHKQETMCLVAKNRDYTRNPRHKSYCSACPGRLAGRAHVGFRAHAQSFEHRISTVQI